MNILKKISKSISNLFNKKTQSGLNNSYDNEIEQILKQINEEDLPGDDDFPDFPEDTKKDDDSKSEGSDEQTTQIVEPNLDKNPLSPYKHPYDDWNDLFTKEGRPLTKEAFETVFNQHINLKNFMNEDKAPILKKIYDDSKFIYDALQPLRDLELNYTLDITGGAVRDFVLNKHELIKDLDFMVSLSWGTRITKELIIQETDITLEELDAVQFENSYNTDMQKSKLLEVCIYRAKDLGTVYFHDFKQRNHILKKDETDEYKDTTVEDRLISVIKTKGEKTNYPIDLLLTDFIKPQFLNDFDFDICKASMCIVNRVYKKDMPKDYSHLISRFNAEMNFWADVVNKKFTYDCTKRTKYQIDKSFTDHLDRLKNKYPEYKVNIISEDAQNYEYAKAFNLKNTFDSTLEKKPQQSSMNKRIKI